MRYTSKWPKTKWKILGPFLSLNAYQVTWSYLCHSSFGPFWHISRMVNTFISNSIYFQLSFCRIALREIGFIGFIGLAFDECGFHSMNPPFEDRFLELSIRNSIICHSRRMRYVAVVARLNLHRLFYVDNPSEVSLRVSDFYVKT